MTHEMTHSNANNDSCNQIKSKTFHNRESISKTKYITMKRSNSKYIVLKRKSGKNMKIVADSVRRSRHVDSYSYFPIVWNRSKGGGKKVIQK